MTLRDTDKTMTTFSSKKEACIIPRMKQARGPETAAEAFATTDWKIVMPELFRNAEILLRRFGFGNDKKKDTRSAALEAQELVNEALAQILGGQRTWVPGVVVNQKSFIAFVTLTMRSVAAAKRGSAAIARREGGLAEVIHLERAPSRAAGPHAQLMAKELLGEIREAISGDAQLVAYYDALAAGLTERKDIQKKLKLASVDDVSVLQKRMRRLLERKGLNLVGNGEPQAPEEIDDEVEDEEVES